MDYLNPCNKNQTAKVLERFFYVSNGREYISVIPDEAEKNNEVTNAGRNKIRFG